MPQKDVPHLMPSVAFSSRLWTGWPSPSMVSPAFSQPNPEGPGRDLLLSPTPCPSMHRPTDATCPGCEGSVTSHSARTTCRSVQQSSPRFMRFSFSQLLSQLVTSPLWTQAVFSTLLWSQQPLPGLGLDLARPALPHPSSLSFLAWPCWPLSLTHLMSLSTWNTPHLHACSSLRTKACEVQAQQVSLLEAVC